MPQFAIGKLWHRGERVKRQFLWKQVHINTECELTIYMLIDTFIYIYWFILSLY